MKILVKAINELQSNGRWDIDFHLPPEEIGIFDCGVLRRVDEVAAVVRDKRDPTKTPDQSFQYIDISAVNVTVGIITNPQELDGVEAPSRARKVVSAYDIIISTCRPTRGAIAVVPVHLHNQIASTGFSIIRAQPDVNPIYLHYALRLPSTLEQFRKWSTGSSYPAILDNDVKKTLIPVPEPSVQDKIAIKLAAAMRERSKALRSANEVWLRAVREVTSTLSNQMQEVNQIDFEVDEEPLDDVTLSRIREKLAVLPRPTCDGEAVAEDEENFMFQLP